MVQGGKKLGKAKKSAGGQRRKAVKSVKIKRKGSAAVERNKAIIETTKAINRKNERVIAAKAISSGNNFFANDIAFNGKKESEHQLAQRNKRESKSGTMTERLRKQISRLKQK